LPSTSFAVIVIVQLADGPKYLPTAEQLSMLIEGLVTFTGSSLDIFPPPGTGSAEILSICVNKQIRNMDKYNTLLTLL
ncbi:hypothetical protein MKD02_09390, partial [[Clostridium] innocuum]|nr:hypothetical protein [[Clostridium] innocuum]